MTIPIEFIISGGVALAAFQVWTFLEMRKIKKESKKLAKELEKLSDKKKQFGPVFQKIFLAAFQFFELWANERFKL